VEAQREHRADRQGRHQPANLDAERAILGAALLDRDSVGLARETLAGPEFYRKEHRLIYEAMLALYEQDQAIDPITVGDRRRRWSPPPPT